MLTPAAKYKMGVRIDETRRHQPPARIDPVGKMGIFRLRAVGSWSHIDDTFIFDENTSVMNFGDLSLFLSTVRIAPLPAVLSKGAWDQEALQSAWAWGLLPENADSTPTRAQGEAMAAALQELG